MDQPKPSASTVPELGKTFASRKIQVASLAIRSSQAASQNPLFPKKQDSFRFCQQPFLSSTPSLPSQQRLAAPTTAVHPTIITTGTTSNGKTQLSLALLDLNERELLDKTWSVLVSRSDAATPTNTKSRRRVTFNDNHEFFYLPPDDADDNPDPSSEVSPDLDLDTTVEAKPPMPPLPAVSPLRPALKTNSDASRIDPISVPPKTPPKCNPDTTMPEDQHSDNGNSDATFVSPPPSVDDGATATSSSLDSPCASVASSVASSSSTSSSYTHARAIDRKGNNIARHVILDILENRSPLKSSPFMLNPAARSSSSSLTLPHPSLSTPPPTRAGPLTPAQRRLVPKDQAHSLDAIQSEINQLIERTKLSSPAPTPSTSNPIQPWPIVAPPSPPSSCPSDDPVEQQDCPDQPDDNGRQPCPIDTDPIPESVGSPDLTDQEPSVALVSSQAPSTEPSPSSSTSTSSLPDTPLPSTSTPTTTSSISQTDLSMETTLPPLLTSTHPFGSVGSSFGSTLLHEFDRISADISVDLLTSAAPQHSEESLTDRDDTSLSVSVVSSVLAQAEENPIQNENVVWHRLDKQQPVSPETKLDINPSLTSYCFLF
ncbi:hypothetical protein DM01DRAFT_1239569 [Hesseltinella vesiculosa]|uniref:Uncharacterized protein n=1 Tax=Hesseltinella vesiculosa TaxID=101127 RepID=A0A1X2GM50_9FUNG|nr:hypothetical protein DM01DRAFT_1239569 [Hesseltinella vesiculosa]